MNEVKGKEEDSYSLKIFNLYLDFWWKLKCIWKNVFREWQFEKNIFFFFSKKFPTFHRKDDHFTRRLVYYESDYVTVWTSNIIENQRSKLYMQIYRKDRLNHFVFLSPSCMYKRVYLIWARKTQPKLCISDAKLRSGIRVLEWNIYQFVHLTNLQ